MGLTLLQTLEQCAIPPGLQLKWPNDLCWNEQKLGGILIEAIILPPHFLWT